MGPVDKQSKEAEIIREMREALDLLKSKLEEAEGGWMVVEFLSASRDKGHWMHQIAKAERLSKPYLHEEDGKEGKTA